MAYVQFSPLTKDSLLEVWAELQEAKFAFLKSGRICLLKVWAEIVQYIELLCLSASNNTIHEISDIMLFPPMPT